jgi:uncharacterized protein YndB with AHSA1/START domain
MSQTNQTDDLKIVTKRLFNFSQKQLFVAFAKPKILKKWWGPDGFTNDFHQFEFKVGGNWKNTMRGPDGREYENLHVFTEISRPNRVIFDHVTAPKFRVEMTFERFGEKTMLHFEMIFEEKKELDAVKKMVIESNEQLFNRLEAELPNMILFKRNFTPRGGFTTKRVFVKKVKV